MLFTLRMYQGRLGYARGVSKLRGGAIQQLSHALHYINFSHFFIDIQLKANFCLAIVYMGHILYGTEFNMEHILYGTKIKKMN